jgi:hypothetical protein
MNPLIIAAKQQPTGLMRREGPFEFARTRWLNLSLSPPPLLPPPVRGRGVGGGWPAALGHTKKNATNVVRSEGHKESPA